MCSSSRSQCTASKWCLKRVTICYANNPNHNPSRSLFVFLHAKLAILEWKFIGDILVEHKWKDLLQQPPVGMTFVIFAAIDKNVVLSWVSMHITIESNATILHQSLGRKEEKINSIKVCVKKDISFFFVWRDWNSKLSIFSCCWRWH